jgi:hypothetical protein
MERKMKKYNKSTGGGGRAAAVSSETATVSGTASIKA